MTTLYMPKLGDLIEFYPRLGGKTKVRGRVQAIDQSGSIGGYFTVAVPARKHATRINYIEIAARGVTLVEGNNQ